MSKKQNSNGNGNGLEHRRQEVQQAVKNACDQLRADGVNPRDYVEQLAWLFFLKAFDEMETRREEEATFEGGAYTRRLTGKYRWSEWSAMIDRPDDMLEFVGGKLWKKLLDLGDDAVGERFRRVFESVRNHSRRGSAFARVVQQINRLHFSDETDVIVLSELYENLLKQVAADSPGYAGEFYTQRHIIRAMVEVTQPRIGEKVYDPCFGTAGFLGECANYMRTHAKRLSTADVERLHNQSFYGRELKPLTYLLGMMNMLLHRVEGANLELANTLEVHSPNVPEKNKYDVILSNPPYGGKMSGELQTNFTIRSGSTEILFVQHIMANLAKGGRAGVIVPEGVLFRGGPDERVRQRLVDEFNVHTILSLPAGCFEPYTAVKTNVLFFDRASNGVTTSAIWYYDLTNDGFELNKSRRPTADSQIPEFLSLLRKRPSGPRSWTVPVQRLRDRDYDLTPQNPNQATQYRCAPVNDVLDALVAKQQRIVSLLVDLQSVLKGKPE